jgi:hypothetical protein
MTLMSLNSPARRVILGVTEAPGADILPMSRACDADRDKLIAHLSECLRLGYIPQDVFQARMGAAAEAATRDQLAALLGDLPGLPAPGKRWWQVEIKSRWPRRWAHLAGAVFALCWMIVAPITIYTATGTPVTYNWQSYYWTQMQHSALALGLVWIFIVTGLGLLATDVIWWLKWENGQEGGYRPGL